ncbi:unnamed protein product [Tuber aestivum]|uniref:H/ACA ribonucleoprotein complex subunit n=1 Tax=Tuber aestivum TaxID=59557 RepID=A0A292PVQ9_9PEZI|nr:unnamed protein product [Tuber aestivum]
MSGRGGFRGGSRGGGGFRGGASGGRGGFGSRAMGSFIHSCEGEMVCQSINTKIPYFNAPIYLENKSQIGKVDEILGPLNQVFFTIKPQEGIVASSFKEGDKFYIGGDKLLPLERLWGPRGRSLREGEDGAVLVALPEVDGAPLAAGPEVGVEEVDSVAGGEVEVSAVEVAAVVVDLLPVEAEEDLLPGDAAERARAYWRRDLKYYCKGETGNR